MVDQQIRNEEISCRFEEPKSIYGILANYLNSAEKHDFTVKGYIDGEENYQAFMSEFSALCRVRFIVRTSWRRDASALPRKSRYGKEERLYWEYHFGNLEVPFSGAPFAVRSCLTKHCQYGSQYYKSAAEKLAKQVEQQQKDDTDLEIEKNKKRRNKPSKKRECPAIMHVREVLMFPDYTLDLEKLMEFKRHLRQEKAKILCQLRSALALQKENGVPINTLRRFYVSVPLPEVHVGHPVPCGGLWSSFHPAVCKKIEDLVGTGIYEARHVRIIVHDYMQELLNHNSNVAAYPPNLVLFPTENDIADYIYMWSITVKPTVIVEEEGQTEETTTKEEVEGSINELMNLLQTCHNPRALAEAKYGMTQLIESVSSQTSVSESPKKTARKRKKADVSNTFKAKHKIEPSSISSKTKCRKTKSGLAASFQNIKNSVISDPTSEDSHSQNKPLETENLLDFMPDSVDQLQLSLSANIKEFDITQL